MAGWPHAEGQNPHWEEAAVEVALSPDLASAAAASKETYGEREDGGGL